MIYEVKLYDEKQGVLRWVADDYRGLEATLREIVTNGYKQSDQWRDSEIIVTIKPHKESEEAELRAKLKRVTDALYD